MSEQPQKKKETKTTHLNREKKIQNDNIRIKIGTTNITNPLSIYIELSFFVMPPDHVTKTEVYKEIINDINKQFNTILKNTVTIDTDIFKSVFISIFATSASGMKPGKKSYVSIQVTLGQKNKPPYDLVTVKEKMEPYIQSDVYKLINLFNEYGFKVFKTKKS